MLSVSSVNNAIQPQFKGNENNNKTTHAGLWTGTAVTAGIAALTLACGRKTGQAIPWIGLGVGAITHMGCGAIVDKYINDKHKAGESAEGVGKNIGSKLGMIVAPLTGLWALYLGRNTAQFVALSKGQKIFSALSTAAVGIGTGYLGGRWLGGIAEHFAKESKCLGLVTGESRYSSLV